MKLKTGRSVRPGFAVAVLLHPWRRGKKSETLAIPVGYGIIILRGQT